MRNQKIEPSHMPNAVVTAAVRPTSSVVPFFNSAALFPVTSVSLTRLTLTLRQTLTDYGTVAVDKGWGEGGEVQTVAGVRVAATVTSPNKFMTLGSW